ncbi:hypothetical protein EO244_16565 [Ancylomarina salipaludis]|uniref:Uncharacterized protein n=1 Tax=Ancylomarina salipaludis TaxID=2501299 RepID=A0A4Q1JHL3_9BACT|nr:hypothetical protein [Ancylomarina salipaludis]RXQ87291.1 hypothetical protein EO244_16565 [Ancylomarina salipaludis]
MKIRRIILVLLLINVMMSCSKSDSTEIDIKKEVSTEFDELLDKYGLFNTDVKYESFTVGVDTNIILFNGRVKERLVIKGFNKLDKNSICSYEGIVLDTIVDIDEGYGVTSTHHISDFSIQKFYKHGDDYAFILWGWAYGDYQHSERQTVTSDFYIVSDQLNKVKISSFTIPDSKFYFNNITPWFGNSFIVETYCFSEKKSKWRCFSMDGVEYYEVYDRYMDNHLIPINLQEYISLDLTFERKNYKTGQTIWESEDPLSDLPADIRIDDVVFEQLEGGYVVCNIKYTQQDGVVGERKFKVDIATGGFTRL